MTVATLLNEAVGLHRAGRLQEAAERYRRVLAQDPRHPEALHQSAALARQSGDLPQALAYLDQAIAAAPREARHHFLRGLTLEDLRRPDDAIASLREAIRIKPDFAEACNNIGIILHDQKRLDEAVAQFREAIRLNPSYARAYNNLGSSLRLLGDFAGARQQFEQATRLKPDYALAFYNLGVSCMDLGLLSGAESAFTQAIRLKPDYAQACNHLGNAQRQLGKLDEAQASFTRAAQLKPGKNKSELISLAYVFWEQGHIDRTVAAYRQAQTIAPYDLKAALGALLSLPAVYHSQQDLLETRQRFADGVQKLYEMIPDFVANNPPEALLDDLRWSNFYLAYQGLDDKPLQMAYSRFVTGMLERIAPQFMQPRARKDVAGRRIRIGFLSNFFMDCTVGMYFRSWITQLNRDRFETFVYYIRPESDKVTQEIAEGCDHFHHLGNGTTSVSSIASAVLADDLDVLVYPELGMDASSFLLAALRLAPVQCAGWGHPVTCGHASMDYYLSSAAMEPPGAQAHYAEKLILLDGLGTYYSKPQLPPAARRADFSLPEGKTLYLFPQSLFKIHPDNDALLARILERDPNGVLVLFAGRHPNITNALFSRLSNALRARGIEPKGRGLILPSMPHDAYLRVNMLCDVMLDTLHWSGGNTSLDALASGLPVVTLPGEFMRGRQSMGMLQSMGLGELIATGHDDYVEKAVRLGTDAPWRKQVAQRIAERSHVIFNLHTPLRQMEAFYVDACGSGAASPV